MGTFKTIFFGLVGGVLLNLSYISWMNGNGWDWAHGFPFGWGGAGLGAMITFIHEIGHTIFAWCYGYFTVPSFDLTYGGGMVWMITDQMFAIIFVINAGLLWLAYLLREYVFLMFVLAATAFFNLAVAFIDFHHSVIDFMGPCAEITIASFFLTRAWLDIAPRGVVERFLNSLIGWGMIVHALLTGFGLLGNAAMRADYYNQKGLHGFGDFDKVADRLSMPFDSVVLIYIGLTLAAALLPIILWTIKYYEED